MVSYNVSYDFDDSLNGTYRKFDKKDQTIRVSLNSSASTSGASNTTFSVRLQKRVLGLGYSTVGTKSFPRNGTASASFTGLKSGHYRMRYEKSTDGITVKGKGTIRN